MYSFWASTMMRVESLTVAVESGAPRSVRREKVVDAMLVLFLDIESGFKSIWLLR